MTRLDSRHVLAACAAIALAAPPVLAEETHAKRHVVAAIGDSLTDPKSGGGIYLEALRKACPESVFESYGRGGEMVNQMRRRFARDVFGEGKPAYTDVIVMGGVNDLYSDETAGRTVEKIEKDLSTMYALARAKGVRVVAITVAPWGGFTKYWNERRGRAWRELDGWILGQAGAGKVDVALDARPVLTCGDDDRLCPKWARKDGLHWTREGHGKVGEALREAAFSDCR